MSGALGAEVTSKGFDSTFALEENGSFTSVDRAKHAASPACQGIYFDLVDH
jgi:hypothetical protein